MWAYVELKSVAAPAFSGFNPIGRMTAGAFGGFFSLLDILILSIA